MSIKISLAWMGAAQAASFAFQFGASVVLARYLTPHEMGVFAVGLAATGLISLLQSFGLQTIIVREDVLNQSITSTTFTLNAMTCVLLFAVTFLFGSIGSHIWNDEGVRRVLWVISVCPLFGILSFLPGAQLERNARFKEFATVTMLTSFVGAASTITFVVLGFSYMSLAFSNVISSAFLSVAITLVGRTYFSCRIGLTAWRRVLRFGLNILAISTVTDFSNRLCELSLGRIMGLGMLGLYSRASSSNGILWGNIHALLSRVLLVDFASINRSGASLRDRYIQTVAVVTGVLWPAFAGVAILSKSLVTILFGLQWLGSAAPLSYLAIASMVLVGSTMSWELCAATGNVRLAARVEGVRAIISLPLFVGACLISLEAVAFTRIIDAALAYVLYRPHLHSMSNTAARDFTTIYAKSAVVTLAALAPPVIVIVVLGTRYLDIFWLFVSVVAGIGSWASMLFALNHPLAGEVVAIFSRRFISRARR